MGFLIITILIVTIGVVVLAVVNREKTSENIEKAFDDTIIKDLNGEITREIIINKLGLFDKNIYNDLFEKKIRVRGESYYNEGKVQALVNDGNKYSCKIQGSMLYRVSITFNKNDLNKIEKVNCNCPYHKEDKLNCKHIYSLLYKLKCEGNRYKLLEEINRIIIAIKNMTNEVNDYIDFHGEELEPSVIKEIKKEIIEFYDEFNLLTKTVKERKLEDQTMELLLKLIQITSAYKNNIQKLMNSRKLEDEDSDEEDSEDEIKVRKKNNKKKSKNKYSDKELDEYGLEDWQKELVNKGEYEPWNFEEEDLDEDDLDEDDYYYDDDDNK